MKRSPELLRRILLEIEASPPDKLYVDVNLDGEHPRMLNYHLKLLYNAGYLKFQWDVDPDTRVGTPIVTSDAITNEGHEFLDSVRDNKIWSETKSKLEAVGGTAGLEIIKVLASSLVKKALEL